MGALNEVVGYQDVAARLWDTACALQGRSEYKEIGVRPPAGLLLHGEPGRGKTFMAERFIKDSGRPAFVPRPGDAGQRGADCVRAVFQEAKEASPAIVFLDDLDQFALWEGGHEAFAAVRSCMDELDGADVFVLATARETAAVPDALLRAGRLGRPLELGAPAAWETEAFLKRCLEQRRATEDVDIELLAAMLEGQSYAAIDQAVNGAAVRAAWYGRRRLSNRDLVPSVLHLVYGQPEWLDQIPRAVAKDVEERRWRAAFREAGHATAREMLEPGSVVFSLIENEIVTGRFEGMTKVRPSRAPTETRRLETEAIAALAGREAVLLLYGDIGTHTDQDVADAQRAVRRLVGEIGTCGVDLCGAGQPDSSPELRGRFEGAVAAEQSRCQREAHRLPRENRALLRGVAQELFNRGLVTMRKIAELTERDARRRQES